MELRLATAREAIGYKEAGIWDKEAGIWDKIQGIMGNKQPAAPQQQPIALQSQDSRQMAQQLDQAWKAFARIYNQQIRPLNSAYKYILNIINGLTKNKENLPGGVNNQIQQLISTLTNAISSETSDVQMLQDVGLAASSIAEAMGMQGGVGQADPTTGRTVQHATPEENAALSNSAQPGQTVPQSEPIAQEGVLPRTGDPGTYNLALNTPMNKNRRSAPQPSPEPIPLGDHAPVEPLQPQVPMAALPQSSAPVSQSTVKGKTEGMNAWKQRLLNQGQTPESADQIIKKWRANKTQTDTATRRRKKKQQKTPQPMLMPSAASASAFIKLAR